MKQVLSILFLLTLLSCETKTQNASSSSAKVFDTVQAEKGDNQPNSEKKIPIDFNKNSDLLDIILLLPDSAFTSWDWNLKDRKKWYNEIKQYNYYTDNNKEYLNQLYLERHKAAFRIVDGYWSINLYKTTDNSYIVITNDKVGDGNSMHFYEVKSGTLKQFSDEKTVFSDFKAQLKRKENTSSCEAQFEELNDPIFEFDFKTDTKVEIESSWYLQKESYENCFIGNAIVYNFNPKTKKFDIEKTYWKPKKVE